MQDKFKDRFKFRIWYEPERKMMLFNNPTLIDGKPFTGGLMFYSYEHHIKNVHECVAKDFKLMQYTGLKDKNGKLIFERDIVKVYNHVGQIIYDQRGCYFGLKVSNSETWGFSLNFMQPQHIEVIGNIYENPELLKEVGNA